MQKLLRIIKLIGIPFIIALGIYSFIRFVWLTDEKKEFSFQDINIEEYLNIYLEEKESIVLIFKDDTPKKSEYEEIISSIFAKKYINVYYFNITNLSDEELNSFEVITGIGNDDDLPILVYTLNGQVYDILKGYQEEHYVKDFVQRNNIG